MKIIVALSGGPDSVTLLHKLYKENHTLLAIHFNHNLRETAKRDELFVSQLCQKLDIPLKIISLNIYDYVKEHKTTIEEGARELRYKYLFKVLEEENFDKIALGHNLNDKCETILMNIVRGTGIDGLNGLKTETGSIIRPLINMTKDEIYQYLKDNNLSYCTDETNSENDYTRNRFRNIIIPELLKINSGLFGNLSRLALIAKETEDFMACETEKALIDCNTGIFPIQNNIENNLSTIRDNNNYNITPLLRKGGLRGVTDKNIPDDNTQIPPIYQGGGILQSKMTEGDRYTQIKKEYILSLHPAIQHRLIKEIIVRAKGTTKDVSQKEVLRLCHLIEKGEDFKTFLDSGKIYAQMKNSIFSVEEKKEILRPVPFEYKITEPETYIKELDKTLIIRPIEYETDYKKEISHPQSSLWDASPLINRGQQSVSPHRENKNKRFYFNINELNDFKIKNIETKIRFQPIGMTGTKKIGDILSDKKIPIETRYMNIILMSGDMPLWIPYVITSEKGKCKSPTHYIKLI